MQTAGRVVASLMAASLLGGCASSTSVRQAKSADPIIVVTTVQSSGKSDKPADPKIAARGKSVKEPERVAGILGVLRDSDNPDLNDVFGGVVGGVIGGSGQAFGTGGLGLSGIGGGGGMGQGIGLGSIGTIGHGSGYGGSASNAGSSSERVKAKLGNVVVSGSLMVDVVQRHVDDHRDDVQACHRLEQAHAGNRWGSVTLRFTIDSTGHVSDVQVYETTLYSRDLESCIAHTVGAFEFPAAGSSGGSMVLLPITF